MIRHHPHRHPSHSWQPTGIFDLFGVPWGQLCAPRCYLEHNRLLKGANSTFGIALGLLMNWEINMHPRAAQGSRTLGFSCLAWRIFGDVPIDKTCPQVGLHSTWCACHDPGLKEGWLFLVWLRMSCCTQWTPNVRHMKHHFSHLKPMEMMSGTHSWIFDPWSCFDVQFGDFPEMEDDHDTWSHFWALSLPWWIISIPKTIWNHHLFRSTSHTFMLILVYYVVKLVDWLVTQFYFCPLKDYLSDLEYNLNWGLGFNSSHSSLRTLGLEIWS